MPCLKVLGGQGRAENKGGTSRATVCRTFSRQTTSPIPIRVFDVLISRIMSMPYSILVGSDTLTRNAPLVLFRVGVCERGRPIIRHPCRGDRPDWCGQSIQLWPPESQSLVLTTCVCLVRHVPSDTRLPEKLVRVAFPWHLGTRRLTAHRPLGVEASCRELPKDFGKALAT